MKKRLPIYWAGIAAFVMTLLLVGANVIGPRGVRHLDLLAGIAPALGCLVGALCMAIGRDDDAALGFYRSPSHGWLMAAFFAAIGAIGLLAVLLTR